MLWIAILLSAFIVHTKITAHDKGLLENPSNLWPGKMNYGTKSNIVSFYEHVRYLKELLKEEEYKKQARLKQDKEEQVYRKYLASRIQSSIARDFLTMRF